MLRRVVRNFKDSTEITAEYKQVPNPNDISRYKGNNILYTEGLTIKQTTRKEDMEVPVSANDIYHVVQPHEEYRIDLLAYKYYGQSTLYWVIVYANAIKDPMYIPAGTELRVPPLSSIYTGGVFARG